jgi:hypothetical protein
MPGLLASLPRAGPDTASRSQRLRHATPTGTAAQQKKRIGDEEKLPASEVSPSMVQLFAGKKYCCARHTEPPFACASIGSVLSNFVVTFSERDVLFRKPKQASSAGNKTSSKQALSLRADPRAQLQPTRPPTQLFFYSRNVSRKI